MKWYITYKFENQWYLYNAIRISFEEVIYVAKLLKAHPLIPRIHISTDPKRRPNV